MTRKVWKFRLSWDDITTIDLPKDAQVLHVEPSLDTSQVSGHPPLFLWALVDPDAPMEPRTFRIAGTGHPITETVEHISTFLMHGGALVFHVFEIVERTEAKRVADVVYNAARRGTGAI